MDYFHKIYNFWWKYQVILDNIPDRKYETTCRCHPYIINKILFSKIIYELDSSFEHNLPDHNLTFIPDNYDKINWMIESLSIIYDQTIFGLQCYTNVYNVHKIFWSVLTYKQRKYIRDYLNTNPKIIKNKILFFTWHGGWEKFSYIMCIVYQKSFDNSENH